MEIKTDNETHPQSNVSENLQELINADQRKKAKETLEVEILKGLNSGESTSMPASDWQDIKNEVIKKHSSRKVKISN